MIRLQDCISRTNKNTFPSIRSRGTDTNSSCCPEKTWLSHSSSWTPFFSLAGDQDKHLTQLTDGVLLSHAEWRSTFKGDIDLPHILSHQEHQCCATFLTEEESSHHHPHNNQYQNQASQSNQQAFSEEREKTFTSRTKALFTSQQ